MLNNNSIVAIILALAILAFPICVLIFSIIFKKEIRQLLNRIGDKKISKDLPSDITVPVKDYKEEDKPNIIPQKKEQDNDSYHSKKINFLDAEVCCNKQSGDYFIVIDEISENLATMIVPNGGRKNLEINLFDKPEIKNINTLLNNKLITNEQFESYLNYVETDADYFIDHYKPKAIGNNESTRYIEPYYLKNYRNMLKNPDTWPSRMLAIIEESHPISRKKLKDISVSKYKYSTSDTNGSFHASLRLLLVDGYININENGKIIRL